MGFPTANLPIAVAGDLPHGVYAAMVRCGDEDIWRRAIINIGTHPTLPEGLPTVEVHILDYAGALYGEQLYLRLGPYVRPEQRFESVKALMAQIECDVQCVREMPTICLG